MSDHAIKKVLVTGGAGYIGSKLVPKLVAAGFSVRVIDLYLFGKDLWPELKKNPALEEVKGDIRDQVLLGKAVKDIDAVIHLACISNDPSFELNPALGKSINYDAFIPLVSLSKKAGVQRFVYASSSSVYGVSDAQNVTEDHALKPLTDYSKFKSLCEPILLDQQSPNFTTTVLRPATVCGYAARQRLDLTVNILTSHAYHNRKIRVFGGDQMRPNIHIEDITDLYELLLRLPTSKIAGKTFNAGYENHRVKDLAQQVRKVMYESLPKRGELEIETTPSDDQRSYHISSEKIARELGFKPRRVIEDAIRDLVRAFQAGKIPNAMTDPRYFNIKTMRLVDLQKAFS
jgi:nucleoside-diphosphate-sugar epimerase